LQQVDTNTKPETPISNIIRVEDENMHTFLLCISDENLIMVMQDLAAGRTESQSHLMKFLIQYLIIITQKSKKIKTGSRLSYWQVSTGKYTGHTKVMGSSFTLDNANVTVFVFPGLILIAISKPSLCAGGFLRSLQVIFCIWFVNGNRSSHVRMRSQFEVLG